MATAFTQRYCEDRANGRLQFTFCCDICQKEYAAPAVELPQERGLFYEARLKNAYEAAFDEAQQNAKGHFNRCVVCGRWVCDADYSPDYGQCLECAEQKAAL